MSLKNSLDQINNAIEYDPTTGIFKWKTGVNRSVDGRVAGAKRSDGALQIGIFGKDILAHRLAWFISYGYLPSLEIDHIDGDRANNKLDNLREATRAQNATNRSVQSNNSTGYKGVMFKKSLGKFVAQITTNGKQKHLGVFDTAEDANYAYVEAATVLHGEFARKKSICQ